jgi:S1-C subfamily serine protease
MDIHEIVCPSCEHVLRSNQAIRVGAKGRCPGCGVTLHVTTQGVTARYEPASPNAPALNQMAKQDAGDPFADMLAAPPKAARPPAEAPPPAPVPPARVYSDDPFADLTSGPAEPLLPKHADSHAKHKSKPKATDPKKPHGKGMPKPLLIGLIVGIPVLVGVGMLLVLLLWPDSKKPGAAVAKAGAPATPAKPAKEEAAPEVESESKPAAASKAASEARNKPAARRTAQKPPKDEELTLPDYKQNDPSPTFDDWLQDLAEAKRRAATEKKDILMLFDGSDWCGWSIRLANEVLHQSEFLTEARRRYVLVLADFPRTGAAKAKVQDPARNRRLAQEYGVEVFPSLVLADAQGRPYAFTGYQEGGPRAWLQHLTKLQRTRTRRDELLATIEKAAGIDKLQAVKSALDFLLEQRLVSFYLPLLTEWGKLARQHDPKNDQAFLETFFEIEWFLQLRDMKREDAAEVEKAVASLDDWLKRHEFKDADRAARLHLVAASLLARVDRDDEAVKYIDAAIAYKPKDKELLARLDRVQASLSGCLGTGFIVGAEGYVLTNAHVVEERKMVRVRLGDKPVPLDAEVVAKDDERDLALVKMIFDAGVTLRPLTISGERAMARGEKVGVLGYGLGDVIGSELKLTTGVVSALPEKRNKNMLLLDCRVNPGNSGGPLCDACGCVTGMVTAKSFVGEGIDSYGMALPAADLTAFVKKHLPEYAPPPLLTKKLEWDEVDRLVSPSVVMIMKPRGKE